MPPRSAQTALPLPRGWRKITRAGVLHAISVAANAVPRLAGPVHQPLPLLLAEHLHHRNRTRELMRPARYVATSTTTLCSERGGSVRLFFRRTALHDSPLLLSPGPRILGPDGSGGGHRLAESSIS